MRFNPPPNWPPAPPGWAPDANWAPDPSWPPPPPGWPLWVDDFAQGFGQGAADASAPVPYPTYGAPWPPAPEPRSRKVLWSSLGVAAAVVLLLVGLVAGVGRFTGAEKPSGKPDLTALTSDMLVDRASFPDPSGGKWISGVDRDGDSPDEMPNLKVDPPECADFYSSPADARQTATATLAKLQPGGLHSMRVRLSLTSNPPDLKHLLDTCQAFQQTFEARGRSVTTDIQLSPLEADDVPSWAVATVITSSSKAAIRLPIAITASTISGYYRGVYVVATSNDIGLRTEKDASDDRAHADELVTLFNTQIEKLEAAE